jgi:hypothetical protein
MLDEDEEKEEKEEIQDSLKLMIERDGKLEEAIAKG